MGFSPSQNLLDLRGHTTTINERSGSNDLRTNEMELHLSKTG